MQTIAPLLDATTRPMIGILLDWQAQGSFSVHPHYAVGQRFFDAIWAAGGLPVGLPLVPEQAMAALHHVHGVLVPGGDYPSPSSWYADPHGIESNHPRAQNSIALLQEILRRDLPLLGICAGMQELTVACGGHLHWRIAQHVGHSINHRLQNARSVAHPILLEAGSQLASLIDTPTAEVNSEHNEGVADVGRAVVVARAPDGVIEAIEVPGQRFAMGVEWHPEFLLGPLDRAVMGALVAAAKQTKLA